MILSKSRCCWPCCLPWYILDGSLAIGAHGWCEICDLICLRQLFESIWNLLWKSPVFYYSSAECSELPSNISTMVVNIWGFFFYCCYEKFKLNIYLFILYFLILKMEASYECIKINITKYLNYLSISIMGKENNVNILVESEVSTFFLNCNSYMCLLLAENNVFVYL